MCDRRGGKPVARETEPGQEWTHVQHARRVTGPTVARGFMLQAAPGSEAQHARTQCNVLAEPLDPVLLAGLCFRLLRAARRRLPRRSRQGLRRWLLRGLASCRESPSQCAVSLRARAAGCRAARRDKRSRGDEWRNVKWAQPACGRPMRKSRGEARSAERRRDGRIRSARRGKARDGCRGVARKLTM